MREEEHVLDYDRLMPLSEWFQTEHGREWSAKWAVTREDLEYAARFVVPPLSPDA